MHICFKSDSTFWLPFHSYTQITVGLDSSHEFWIEVHELRWTFPCYTTALNILIIILISAWYKELKFWSRRHHRSGTQHIFRLSHILQTIKCWTKKFNANLFPALKCSRIAGFKRGHVMSLARVWSFPGGTISRLCLRLYLLWLVRLTNCLKMGWSLRPKRRALLKINECEWLTFKHRVHITLMIGKSYFSLLFTCKIFKTQMIILTNHIN